jgi:hypothetical protein
MTLDRPLVMTLLNSLAFDIGSRSVVAGVRRVAEACLNVSFDWLALIPRH